jgi:hypothetical protein
MKIGTPATLVKRIEARILLMRGERVMLDADLAELYGVATKVLVQAVKRNAERFPLDFMFQLTLDEFPNLRSQIVTSSWGGRRYPPYAFTEHGAAGEAAAVHRVPGRGGGTALSGEEGAAKGLMQPRRRLLTQQTRLPESPLCRIAKSPK